MARVRRVLLAVALGAGGILCVALLAGCTETAPPPGYALPATTRSELAAAGGQPGTGISVLSSYTAQVEYKQEELQPSPAVESWVTMTVQYQSQPAPGIHTLHVIDKLWDQSQPGGQMQMVVTGQDVYILTPEQGAAWTRVPLAQGGTPAESNHLLDPNRLAQDMSPDIVAPANLVNPHEPVHGEDTSHYRVQGPALSSLLAGQRAPEAASRQLLSGQADLWVSNQGRYLKAYALDATLSEIPQGSGQETGIRQVYESGRLLVTSANGPVSIATPPAAGVTNLESPGQPTASTAPRSSEAGREALRSVPPPPGGRVATGAEASAEVRDAMEAYVTPGLPAATYLSGEPVANIFQFYQAEMPRQGWRETMRGTGNMVEEPSLLAFSKDGLNLQIVIMPDGAKQQSVVFAQVEG